MVSHSAAGTFHSAAAAAISICRPAAPTWRSGSQFIGVAVLPPATWRGIARIQIRLLDLHVRPVDIELLGDQHRQHHLHALADLGVLRGDGDLPVRRDADIGVQRHRVRPGLAQCRRTGEIAGMVAVSSRPPPMARLALRKFLRASMLRSSPLPRLA